MQVLWYIPTSGDGRYLGTRAGARASTLPYMRQIARAADDLGYYGVLVPTGAICEDAWVLGAALAEATQRLRFLIAVRPGLMSPTLSARMAASFDRNSHGRLLINVVTGGDPAELAADGMHLPHDERYEVTDEFLTIWRGVLRGETVDFEGKHLKVTGARQLFPQVQQPYPPLYFGGSSPAAHRVAAKHADLYLTWAEPPDHVAEKIADVRARAAAHSRFIRFGIRLHVIVRETEEEAWRDADRLIQYLDDDTIAAAQHAQAQDESEGQRRMRQLHGGNKRANLEISPSLWAGFGLVRGGAGTALVGAGETVAQRMQEYAALGIDTFILSGYPHLEEAYRVAELVFPRLPLDHGTQPQEAVHLAHDARYEVTDEFLTIWRGILSGETVDFEGRHHKVTGAQQRFPPVQQPYPPLYFGGSSPAAHRVAARHADLYLTWGEPPTLVAEKIADVRAQAAAQGRPVRFGIRLHVIVRETGDEAWQAAHRLIHYLDDEVVAAAQQALARSESEGQRRMRVLHEGQRGNLEVSPNLWAGVGLVRGGAGTALVGDPRTVAARMEEYAALGIDTFIMSGWPHLEEAYRFAELVFPLLPLQQDTAGSTVPAAPFADLGALRRTQVARPAPTSLGVPALSRSRQAST